MVFRHALLLGLLLPALTACEAERFFGPYQVTVPTAIGESSAARTFEMPLDASDQAEQEELALCLENQPEREVPCICDYPVLTLGETYSRIDYRLSNSSRQVLNVLVWVGVEKQGNAPDPARLPDLPWIQVLGEHLHRVEPMEVVDTSFLEEEVAEMAQAWSLERYGACVDAERQSPSPTALLIGLSLPDEESDVSLDLEWVVRVRAGD